MSNVHIIPEALWREQRRKFRSFDSEPPTFITADQLVNVLNSAGPTTWQHTPQHWRQWTADEMDRSYVLVEPEGTMIAEHDTWDGK